MGKKSERGSFARNDFKKKNQKVSLKIILAASILSGNGFFQCPNECSGSLKGIQGHYPKFQGICCIKL